MAEPRHLPPIPHHVSVQRGKLPQLPVTNKPQPSSGSTPPPPPNNPPPSRRPQLYTHPPSDGAGYGAQPTLSAEMDNPYKNVPHQSQWTKGAENVRINMEPLESRHDRNDEGESDTDDDNLSSITSSNSSVVSDAPSVQHFNISFIFKKTFREHDGARAFKSIRGILKVVYMCSLRWTYNLLLFSVGILVAFLWAIINALVAFLQAWIVSPLTRVSLVIMKGVLPLILDPLSLILKACAAGCGGGCSDLGAAGNLQSGLQRLAKLGEAT